MSRKAIKWTIAAVLSVAASAVATVIIFTKLYVPEVEMECATRSGTISESPDGDKIQYTQRTCGGIAFSDAGEMSLIPKGGEPRLFFSFEPSDSSPNITWGGANTFFVSVHGISLVHTKVDRVGMKHVIYKIN